ncbi:hypothetical protein [Halorussus caseinilyticus]|uniref:hypothetical protein n=1 Tax=Halorussus caseinilyticus TaxID=3034025 RepID=UPI0023E8B3D8|nr:hypothetical protein [Halorussus sp. DT72]
MSLDERITKGREFDVHPATASPLDDGENRLVVLAGVLITAGVLYDVYRRETKAKAATRPTR